MCEQDNISTPTPKKKTNQTMSMPKDPDAIFKQIVEDNTFPPLSEVPSSPVECMPIPLSESKEIALRNKDYVLVEDSPVWL